MDDDDRVDQRGHFREGGAVRQIAGPIRPSAEPGYADPLLGFIGMDALPAKKKTVKRKTKAPAAWRFSYANSVECGC